MTLEQRLSALAADAFPPTPDLAAAWAVKHASQAPKTAQGWRWRERRRWLPAVLVALLIPAAAVTAGELFSTDHVTIRRVATLPAIDGESPDLGERVPSAEAASERAGFAVRTLSEEAAIYVDLAVVTLAYDDVVVTEARARPDEPDILIKTIGPGTNVERVTVGNEPGFFLTGAPHEVAYLDPTGRFQRIRPRLAGNTLVYETGGLVIRIEGEDLTLARALQLSRALAAPGST